MNPIILLACAVLTLPPMEEPERPLAARVAATRPPWRLAVDRTAVDATPTAAALIGHADGAETTLDEFDRRLLAANWIMARQLEPMATRLLLGIPEEDDALRAGETIALASDQLDRAQHLWTELAETDVLDDEQRWRRADDLHGLRAFAAMFAVVWPSASLTDEQRDDALRQAVAKLAIVLEDDREDVVASATLWQAYVYGRRERLARAMDLLPMALDPPKGRGVDGFYARLLRCRYIAQVHEAYATPIALLARIEERCLEWFDDAGQQRRAQRAAALVRRQITAQWAEALRRADKPDRAAWCDRAVARIDEDYFAGAEPAELLRLGLAVPGVVDLKNVAEVLRQHDKTPRPSDPETPAAPPFQPGA